MVRDVLFRKAPPLYVDPAALSRVQIGAPERPIMPIGGYVPAGLYASWRETLDLPIAAAALARGVRDMRMGDRTESVQVRPVTPEFFDVLGIRARGRATARSRDAAGGRTGPRHPQLSRVGAGVRPARPDAIGRRSGSTTSPTPSSASCRGAFWFSDWGSPVWTLLDPRTVPPDEGLEMIVRRPAELSPALLDARLQGGLAEYARRLPAGQRELRLKVSGIEGTPIARQAAPILPYILGGVRPADAAHRLRQRRHPDDRAVDGEGARDRHPRVDRREPRPGLSARC